MRVFLDANILFSASFPRSHTRLFLSVLSRHATLLTNLYAAEEARRNLQLKKPDALSAFEELLTQCEMGEAVVSLSDIKLAKKDLPILGGAIAGNATHLLTGDERDFGVLWGKKLQGVKIVSSQMLANELKKKDRLKRT